MPECNIKDCPLTQLLRHNREEGGYDGYPNYQSRTEEFSKRMESENQNLKAEDNRQNKRLDTLEANVREMSSIAISVEKLATNMESMVKIQEQQGKRLETLESRDGEMWRKVVGYIITAVIGLVLGYIFTQIGI